MGLRAAAGEAQKSRIKRDTFSIPTLCSAKERAPIVLGGIEKVKPGAPGRAATKKINSPFRQASAPRSAQKSR